LKLAVFVSGRGSNLQAILESADLKDIIEVEAVISDKRNCPAFQIADKFSIPAFSIGDGDLSAGAAAQAGGKIGYNDLYKFLRDKNIELIVLAGFLKLIPLEVIKNFRNRIINIHPALLPSFGGSGMYGMNVHRAVFNSSAKVSGPTVHFVDENYDTGKIIAQRCIDITDVNSPEEIAERVLIEEHKLLPFVIKKIAEGKISLSEGRVRIS
jgi:formyltetrahydrofolate-dependent phosphoribosylglycinamide formyltransferase